MWLKLVLYLDGPTNFVFNFIFMQLELVGEAPPCGCTTNRVVIIGMKMVMMMMMMMR